VTSLAHKFLRLFAPLALVFTLLAPSVALAYSLPPSEPGRSVYDFAGLWTPATIASATATVKAIKVRTGAEVAVVSIPTGLDSVSTGQARTDALAIMNTWGVGQSGVNDGLVILFDMDTSLAHGQIYLYTGTGFRDLYLSDSDATVISDDMLALAKARDLNGALLTGMSEVDAAVVPGGNPNIGQTPTPVDLSGVGAAVSDFANNARNAFLLGLIPAVVLLGLFVWAWRRWGRDPEVPLIDDSVLLPAPPPGLTPAMAAALRLDGVDQSVFTTALVDLAHHGVIAFREHKSLFGSGLDIVPPATASANTGIIATSPEGGLAASIIAAATANGGELTSATLRQGTGASLYTSFRSALGAAAAASPWFKDDPTSILDSWRMIGGALIVACFAIPFFARSPIAIFFVIPIGIAAIILAAASGLMVSRTEEGATVLAMGPWRIATP
jgi:uncharacterized membrane protein YgcG